jgi:hypothetical protein
MPLVKVIKKILGPPIQIGGTLEVTGNININSGLVIELNTSVFNAAGVWTLITWTGSLTGSATNITIANNTSFTAGAVYQEGSAFKILLS